MTHDMWHVTGERRWTFSQNVSSLALLAYVYWLDLRIQPTYIVIDTQMFQHFISCSAGWLFSFYSIPGHRTMYVISSVVKHSNFKLTSLLPARNTLPVIKQPYTPSSMVWLLLVLEAAFICWFTVRKLCCLAIEFIQYKMMSFTQENVQSVQFVDVFSVPKFCLRGITWNQKMLHALDNKSW